MLAALVAYLPLLATKPGRVGADTKTYLYLDPGRLLADAPYVWHDQIGMGTVTHQNIGYLFPMGPYYWLLDTIGVPDWVAQRLWLATVIFAAGMGVRFLARTMAPGGLARMPGPLLVAMFAYMLSPYFLAYASRISVILLPWAALPWLIGLTARSLRSGGWRNPALFALTILAVGGINATALVLVGLGPALWVVWAVWVEREVAFADAVRATARIGLLTIGTSAWWIAGLWANGRYGLPVLRYTETYRTVAEVSSAPEVMRGLGYWFFYGGDKLGPWIEPSVSYTQNLPLIALSFAVPTAALLAAALTRHRYRGFCMLLVAVGGLAAVAAHPWDGASALGSLFAAASRTDAGLSMRSTPRAVPLVALGSALLLGTGVAALARRLPRLEVATSALACALLLANLPSLWTGALVADNLDREEELPAYWPEAARWLDGRPHSTRVLEIPGSDFASYRWGNTVDPVTPGLMDRPYVARELFQWGSPQSAGLLNAFDRRFHEEVADPESIVPIARLLGIGDLVVRSDLQFERFRTARPRLLWDHVLRADELGNPTMFGDVVPNLAGPQQQMIDEVELGTDITLEDPPQVAVFEVPGARPVLRTVTARHPLVLAGDGEGIVDAASIGLLGPDQLLLSAPTVVADPELLELALRNDADLLITDTNRRRAHRWGTLRETTGYTERAGEQPLAYDPTDQRLEVFADADDDSFTVSEWRLRPDGSNVTAVATATSYGNPITFTPDDRPANALDGDPETAWRVGAIDEARGERLHIRLDEQVTTDHFELLQPINLQRNRWITEVRVHFDDGESFDVVLDETSQAETAEGQRVEFPERSFTSVEIEILDTNIAVRPRYDGFSGVGFAEVRIPGVGIEQVVRPPVDLLDAVGESSGAHRLLYVFSRLRSNPAEPVRLDEEPGMARILSVPTDRAFSVSGQARLSAYVDDHTLDRLLGSDPDATGVVATSSTRLPGSLSHRASSAIDGDLTTWWSPIFGQQHGQSLRFELAEPVTFDAFDLAIIADGRHSVPTRLRLEGSLGGAPSEPLAGIDLPPVLDGNLEGHVVTLPIQLDDTLTVDDLVVVIERVRQVPVRDWYSDGPNITPVAIADVGIDGLQAPGVVDTFDSGCREDLLRIDDRPVAVRVQGPAEDALARRSLQVTACEGSADGLEVSSGEHILRSTPGRVTGIDLDRLLVASDSQGLALDAASLPRELPSGPDLHLDGAGRVTQRATIDQPGTEPFWIVLGQSLSDGWELQLDGAHQGPPTLVNGFANGWLVDGGETAPLVVALDWAPQRIVWAAIAFSVLATLFCVWLVVAGRRDRRATHEEDDCAQLVCPPLPSAPTLSARSAALLVGAFALAVLVNLPSGLRLAAVIPLAVIAWFTLRSRRGRDLPALLAGFAVALSGAYVVVQQYRHGLAPDFAWPTEFDRAHIVALSAILLAGLQAMRDAWDRRRGTRRGADEPVPPRVAAGVAPLAHDSGGTDDLAR